MLEILLVRHGRPVCDERTRIRGRDFAAWVAAYDLAPLDITSPPPPSLRARAEVFPRVVTSTLRRSRDSARLLTARALLISERVFEEAGIPTAFGVGLSLRPRHWDAVARIAWLCGWSGGAESLGAARGRAAQAAERLLGLAQMNGSALLVGHGMMNMLIYRALRARGWTGSGVRTSYWGLAELRHAAG